MKLLFHRIEEAHTKFLYQQLSNTPQESVESVEDATEKLQQQMDALIVDGKDQMNKDEYFATITKTEDFRDNPDTGKTEPVITYTIDTYDGHNQTRDIFYVGKGFVGRGPKSATQTTDRLGMMNMMAQAKGTYDAIRTEQYKARKEYAENNAAATEQAYNDAVARGLEGADLSRFKVAMENASKALAFVDVFTESDMQKKMRETQLAEQRAIAAERRKALAAEQAANNAKQAEDEFDDSAWDVK